MIASISEQTTEKRARTDLPGEESPLSPGNITSLQATLDAAKMGLNAGAGPWEAFINQVQALVQSGRLQTALGDELTSFSQRIIACVN